MAPAAARRRSGGGGVTALETIRQDAPIAVREWGDERLPLVVDALMRVPEPRNPGERIAPVQPFEVELFAVRCQRTGLDPFHRQIYAVYRRDHRSPLGRTLDIQTGIDGFRLIAHRTGEMDGYGATEWLGRDGAWRDHWAEDYPPVAARIYVRRKGSAEPYPGVAHWAEYAQTYDGKPQGLWSRMPANQLAKCAEALALRRAFPAELGDVYTTDEMAHRDAEVPPAIVAERQDAERDAAADLTITPQDADEIQRRRRAADLTAPELRAILRRVAGEDVDRLGALKRHHLAAVLQAIDIAAAEGAPPPPPPTVPPATVAPVVEPEIVDAEDVEPSPEWAYDPSRSSAGARSSADPEDEPSPDPEGAPDSPADQEAGEPDAVRPPAGNAYGPGAP